MTIELQPFFEVAVQKTVENTINQWAKKRENEKPDDYDKRVNESAMKLEYKKAKEMVINQCALQQYKLETPEKDEYNSTDHSYAIKFQGLKSVSIKVSPEDAKSFEKNYNNLKYQHPNFELNDSDEFTLSYIEAFDAENNKTYTFDNRPKITKVEPVVEVKVVPISIIKQVVEEESTLKSNLTEFIQKEVSEKKITQNISTNVNTYADTETDLDGKQIVNYHIEYTYEVIKKALDNVVEDYPSGEFRLNKSNAAKSTMQIIKKTFETELAKYLTAGKKVTIKITGTSDASPVNKTIPYDGEYGEFESEPFFLNGNFENISISKKEGISSNEQLGYLRTYGVRKFIENDIEPLKITKNSFHHYVIISKEKGAQFRRVSIEIIIHNAFSKSTLVAVTPAIDSREEKKTVVTVSDVDVNIPVSSDKKEKTFVLIFGNEDYSSFQPNLTTEANVDFAANDAKIFKEYCAKTLGVPDKNIILKLNATSAQMKQAITKFSIIADLMEGNAELIFYYAGHGLPDEKTKEACLMPVDITGLDVSQGININWLYAQLNEYSTKKTTVFLDACFNGGARNKNLVTSKGVTELKIKELPIPGNILVVTSSSGDENSCVFKEKQHGLFTYYLLKKLQETNGNVNYKDLTDGLIEKVSLKSISTNNKKQTPQVYVGEGIKNTWSSWNFSK
jgi:Caspase domain